MAAPPGAEHYLPVERRNIGGLNAFYADTRHDLMAWGLASISSCVLLLFGFSFFPQTRRTPGWQFLYSTLCDMYVAGGFVMLSFAGGTTVPEGTMVNVEHLLCHSYSNLLLSVLGLDIAANSWRLFMYVDLIVVYHNPFRPNTARPLYHLAVGVIVVSWLVMISSSDALCSSEDGGAVNVLTLTWGLVYGPFLLFVLLGGSLYLAVEALLSRDKGSQRISRLARQRVLKRLVRPVRPISLASVALLALLCLPLPTLLLHSRLTLLCALGTRR